MPSKSYFKLLCAVLAVFLFTIIAMSLRKTSELTHLNESYKRPSASLDDIFDFSRCGEKITIFIEKSDHPLSQALSTHPSAVDDKREACLLIVVIHHEDMDFLNTWRFPTYSSMNVVVVNLSPETPYSTPGKELVIQPHFAPGEFRDRLDFAVFADVIQFNQTSWQDRPQILPLHRKHMFAIMGQTLTKMEAVKYVNCDGACEDDFRDSTFCLLNLASNFQQSLLAAIRVGCIPVIRSLSQPLPFEGLLDWRRVAFRFPRGHQIKTILYGLRSMEKEEILEMRRMGRVFSNRLEHSDALADTLIAALAERMQISLPTIAKSNDFITSSIPANASAQFTRIPSYFQSISAVGMYSYSRWQSGRSLRYASATAFDTPMLPNGAHYYNGTKETMVGAVGVRDSGAFSKRIGLTRDTEQFTVVVLTYNRDASLVTVLKRLNNCPFLNKVIIVWNNQERTPGDIWPTIHVPIEFIFPENNTLLNRFLPFEAIETEAVVSLDDDQELSHGELVFAFRMWRENRDRLVGFPDRYTYMESGKGKYGLGGRCEYSLILTGFAFMHKEFLYEFTYNQHPLILEHIEKNRNCEDLAMNFLVSHVSRKAPLRVVKKTSSENPQGKKISGLSGKKNHYSMRSGCVQLFSEIYGYNPLLQTQQQAAPRGGCVAGL